VSLASPTRNEVFGAIWWGGTLVICASLGVALAWLVVAVTWAWVRAMRWAIRADRKPADEIDTLRKFHESIDGTLDKILRRGA
jgi:ABC-type nickel/cobalt efflux system permease component RcnA